MRQRLALITVAIVFAVLASGQNPPAAPKPGPEIKKLAYFAGTWKVEGEIKPGPFGPGGKLTGTEHNQWMDGGFFLVSHSDEKTPMGAVKGFAVYGYDPNAKVYTYDEFNSSGEAVHAKGTVEGDTWTWANEEKMEGKTIKGRFTAKITSPTSYAIKFEMQPEGGAWATVLEGTTTKQTTKAATEKK